MSAELFDGESAGALALPAVDILPAKPSRKSKAVEPEQPPAALLEASPQGWALPAPHASTNPWSDAPVDPALAAFPAPVGHVDPPAQAVWPAVAVPSDPGADVSPAGLGQPPVPMPDLADPAEADPAPKKFFGMTVRRPKKTAPPAEPTADLAAELEPAPAEVVAQLAAGEYQAVVAPVAAWPTDVGVPVVAGAEPQHAADAPAAPAAFAPIGLHTAGPADAPAVQAPLEAVQAGQWTQPPVDESAPVQTEPVPTAPSQAVAVASVAAPVVAPVDAAELASLRAQVVMSEGQRLAAEQRADQAVAYAQQTQARLGQLESDSQARIAGAETKARAAANEAQDWQIRHREAEATIAELAQSVAGAENRMAELRAERDDLAAALDVATAPDQHAPTS